MWSRENREGRLRVLNAGRSSSPVATGDEVECACCGTVWMLAPSGFVAAGCACGRTPLCLVCRHCLTHCHCG